MKNKWKLMLSVVTALLLLTLLVPTVALAQTIADRDIADQTLAPGETTLVTVTINVDEAEALSLEETPPAGWDLVVVNDGGASIYRETTNEWVWFQAAVGVITVVYNLTVPVDAVPGDYAIAGTIIGADWTAAVGGETAITVSVVPELVSIAASPAEVSLVVGQTQQLTITATYIDASTADVTATSTYVSDDEAVATVSTAGLITAVGAGSATIAVSYTEGEITTTTTVAVSVVPELVELVFTGSLDEGERETLLTPDIPGGATLLDITLVATADIDLELYDGDTFVIGWEAIISSSGATTGTYEGDAFAYSGWDGGDEYITAVGPLSRAYTLKVFGFEAGDYEVTVSYMLAGPDLDPPTITIGVPATAVGELVTITATATDPSGVMLVYFMVSSPSPEGWPESLSHLATPQQEEYEDLIAIVISFGDEASVTFATGWAGTYTVEAWAVDNSAANNMTPEGAPVTDTFVVIE